MQSRAPALTAPVHAPQTPAAQVCVPRLQIPTFAAGPQAWVAPVWQAHPSLDMPLQFSSPAGAAAQVSLAAGPTLPLQAPQALLFLSAATTHV